MGCGCAKRASKLINILGVEFSEEYIRKHHFKATLKAVVIFIKNLKRDYL